MGAWVTSNLECVMRSGYYVGGQSFKWKCLNQRILFTFLVCFFFTFVVSPTSLCRLYSAMTAYEGFARIFSSKIKSLIQWLIPFHYNYSLCRKWFRGDFFIFCCSTVVGYRDKFTARLTLPCQCSSNTFMILPERQMSVDVVPVAHSDWWVPEQGVKIEE